MMRDDVTNSPVSYSEVSSDAIDDQRPHVERGDDRRERHGERGDRQVAHVVARQRRPRELGAVDEERDEQQRAGAHRELDGEERRQGRAGHDERHHADDEDHLLEHLVEAQQPVAQLHDERERQRRLRPDQHGARAGQRGTGDHDGVVAHQRGERDGGQHGQREQQQPHAEQGAEQSPPVGAMGQERQLAAAGDVEPDVGEAAGDAHERDHGAVAPEVRHAEVAQQDHRAHDAEQVHDPEPDDAQRTAAHDAPGEVRPRQDAGVGVGGRAHRRPSGSDGTWPPRMTGRAAAPSRRTSPGPRERAVAIRRPRGRRRLPRLRRRRSAACCWQGLTDRVFGAAPGTWRLVRCAGCASGYLDPRPTPASIGRAYDVYYTHGEVEDAAPRVALHDLRQALANDHLRARWGYERRRRRGSAAAMLARLLPLRGATADREIRHLPGASRRPAARRRLRRRAPRSPACARSAGTPRGSIRTRRRVAVAERAGIKVTRGTLADLDDDAPRRGVRRDHAQPRDRASARSGGRPGADPPSAQAGRAAVDRHPEPGSARPPALRARTGSGSTRRGIW